MITDKQKSKIVAAIASDRQRYPSDAKHAASLGVSTSSYSDVKNGRLDRTLSEAEWIRIARKLSVDLREGMEWKAANTAT